jgi:hypothetical protein
MTSSRSRWRTALAIVAWLVIPGAAVHAQTIEVTPFGGYRLGGDFFELLAAHPVDRDGALTLGAAVDFPLSNGFHVEGVFTHERADFFIPTGLASPPARWDATIDHWLGGGLQELDGGRVRPFLTGLIGFTRYAAAGDSEIRFAAAAGGGVKVFQGSPIGLRLDGRVFATLVDAGGSASVCAAGRCFVALHLEMVWQAEFTTGIVFSFP